MSTAVTLDLADIQGNIHRPYSRYGFPHCRHFFFHAARPDAARRFMAALRPRITSAVSWGGTPPKVTLNIGFTFQGLLALDLPTRTLRLLPDEFIDGMAGRADILGDVDHSAPDQWNPVWQPGPADSSRTVHIWASLNGAANPDTSPVEAFTQWTEWLVGLADASKDAVTLLAGHGADGSARWQDTAALTAIRHDGSHGPVAREHFGFTDGISDAVFRGQFEGAAEALAVIGGGKLREGPFNPQTSWAALEAGEFILGQVDEGQELPLTTAPAEFVRNGTFMVWRKLCQDVATFEATMRQQASLWQKVTGETDEEAAYQTVCAKIVGRWKTGIPLAAAPDWKTHQRMMLEWQDGFELALRKPRDSQEEQRLAAFEIMLTGFRYGDDPNGAKCPFGAHIRRANPRDMLDPVLSATRGASTLTNRRRLLRRGLPYVDPDGERGIVFMGICTSLFRQFEFIQQQWMNYGLDFEAGNDSCPLIGNRTQPTKHVIPAGPANATSFIAASLPAFVSTRGGNYFFLPSLTAIRMIAMGTVDPT